ncbi:hypothetical protein OIU79_029869 [Salix purpurea]|uniref:Uncharacterized protein n=1 Tax=Salix purpurea TaxID=77065 RepID=A0A9Q0VJU9_SALPP|nr:hypothetical protein OIU79_029869 [Salix purpurea]
MKSQIYLSLLHLIYFIFYFKLKNISVAVIKNNF